MATKSQSSNTTTSGLGNNYPVTNNNLDATFAFESNPLDNYDLSTYHFRFFMVSTAAQNTGDWINPTYQTVIAETGISDIVIDDVSIRTLAGPTHETGTGTSTELTFKLTEPAGARLMDDMYYASLQLGIGNWNKSPYYIELSFRARSPSISAPVVSSTDTTPSGYIGGNRWVWPIAIKQIEAQVDKVGTIYTVSALLYDNIAQSDQYFVVQHNLVVDGKSQNSPTPKVINTVTDALSQLFQKINLDQVEKIVSGYTIPDFYEFEIDPSLANLNLFPANDSINSSRSGNYYDAKSKSLHFSTGTSIDRMVDTILANTEYFQKLSKGSVTSQDNKSTNQTSMDDMKKLWRVLTYSWPIAFDPGRNNNANHFKIIIIPYQKGNLPSNTAQTSEAPVDGKKRYDTYKQKGILKKQYNYLFTGLNDQVLNFDVKFNMAFTNTLARFDGIYYNSSSSNLGKNQHEALDAEQLAVESLVKLVRLKNSPDSSDSDVKNAEQAAANAVNSNKLSATQQAQYQKYLSVAKNPSRLNVSGIATSAEQQNQQTIKNNPLQFVTQVQPQNSQYASKLTAGQIKPVTFSEQPVETSLGYGIEQSYGPGKNQVSALFTQAMYQGIGGDLLRIKMTIKGDPFWIQPAPISRDIMVFPQPTVASVNRQYNTANFDTTDNFFLLRMRTPRLFVDPPNGPNGLNTMDPYTDVDTINGVYQVISVIHNFMNGLFTQEVEAIVDPVIDVSKFLKDIEAYESTNAQTLLNQSGNNVPNTSNLIPSNSIKTNPIINNNLPVIDPGYSSIIPSLASNNTQKSLQVPGINTNMINQIGVGNGSPFISTAQTTLPNLLP